MNPSAPELRVSPFILSLRPIMFSRSLLPLVALMYITVPIPIVYADDPDSPKIVGQYTAVGEDITGVKYTAKVTITEEGDAFRVQWTYANGTQFIGIGIREGSKLSVSWAGAAGPGKVMVGIMIYEIKKSGVMEGKWTILGAKGKVKTETLSPQTA